MMETPQQTSNNFVITHVESEGPFLRLWCQRDRSTASYVERALAGYASRFALGHHRLPPEASNAGVVCCTKQKDNRYYRVRINAHSKYYNARCVDVHFIDVGRRDAVPVTALHALDAVEPALNTLPPLAEPYLLAEAVCVGGEWNEAILSEIGKEVRAMEVNLVVVGQAARQYLVRCFAGINNLAVVYISRGLMQHTSLATQEAVLLSTMPRPVLQQQQQPPQQSLAEQSIATYKAFALEPGSEYEVYVSYVTDGPCNFSVQLKQSESVLGVLMKEINSIPLTPLESVPIPGAVCFARCLEDGSICRAVVTNEVDGQFKVYYVDFGNFEVVPLDALYEISFKYVVPRVMALRFALSKIEKASITLEMQCAFKKFVDNRLVKIKVNSSGPRSALPRCDLWDPVSGVNALDVIRQAATNLYPEQIMLNRGITLPVRISHVISCNRFYVQPKNKENELRNLMEGIQQSCRNSSLLEKSALKKNLPCCALYPPDQQWYRALIKNVRSDGYVSVYYVDFGNEDLLESKHIKPIAGTFLTELRPQAIECCLNGYQKIDPEQKRDGLLAELILDNEFNMKVIEMQNGRALVELIDNSSYNVASLLLNKIAATTNCQISPILVQEGHRLEHRKSNPKMTVSPKSDFTNNRNPSDRGNRSNESSISWRQPSNEFRSHSSSDHSIEIEDGWGQNSSNHNSHRSFKRDEHRGGDRRNKGNDYKNERFTGSENKFDRFKGERKKAEYKRDGSEISSNSSDRSFTKSNKFRSNINNDNNSFNRKDQSFGRKNDFPERRGNSFEGKNNSFDKRPHPRKNDSSENGRGESFGNRRDDFSNKGNNVQRFNRSKDESFQKRNNYEQGGSSFNKRTNTFDATKSNKREKSFVENLVPVTNPAPNDTSFKALNVPDNDTKVIISWFHNPVNFYVQLKDYQTDFITMMEKIQKFYKKCKPTDGQVGAPIIGLFPEDGVLYRAKILEIINKQYKVFYVDFGNISTIDKIWPISMEFMEFPAQAVHCSLTGLQPISDNWLDAEKYSQYFDKDEFVCKFLSKNDNEHLVELKYEDMNISQKLIQDCLALSPTKITPDFDLNLLQGQQFTVMLYEAKSPTDITVNLPTGVPLKCVLSNTDSIAENSVSILNENIGKILIIYVNSVIKENLAVIFYDLTGKRLDLWKDKNNIVIEPLCPLLVNKSVIEGYIPYVEDNIIYIQPVESSELLTYLVNQMFDHYDNLTTENSLELKEGQLVAAKSTDGNWYRSRILKLNDATATVYYVDYGNSEEINVADVKELTTDYIQYSIQCLRVKSNTSTDDLLDKTVTIQVNRVDNEWEGVVLGSSQNDIEEDKISESLNVEVCNESLEELPNAESTPQLSPTPDKVPEKIGISVTVSHIDTPNDFYIQLVDDLNSLDELQNNLQKQIEEMADLENPTVGSLCAAPYSLDKQWYRARVLDADSDITTVRFIDYGNTDVIDNQSTHVKTLPQNLLSFEVYATRCSLKIKPIEEEWNLQASELFEKMANVDNLTVEFLNQDEKIHYVELYSNGKSIREVLIAEGMGKFEEIDSINRSVGFVSHLNSPSEFWIQLENCIDELEFFADQLANAESFPELQDHTPGTLCAALFPDDEMWYRARILSNTVAGLEVLFIDYGNSCISCSLRELPEELTMLPPLAQKCSLKKPESIETWLPQMIEKFSDISADGKTAFEVNKLTSGETALVELSLDGEDVSKLLIPKTENGRIKNIQALNCFQIEINGQFEGKTFGLKTLSDIQWTEDSLESFRKLCSENDVFQIETIPDGVVILYLNGNDIRLDLGGIKASSEGVNLENKEYSPKRPSQLLDDNKEQSEDKNNGIIEQFKVENTSDQSTHNDLMNESKEIEEDQKVDLNASTETTPSSVDEQINVLDESTNDSISTDALDDDKTSNAVINESNSPETTGKAVIDDVIKNVTNNCDISNEEKNSTVQSVLDDIVNNVANNNENNVHSIAKTVVDTIVEEATN